jgi:hypothetical protein
VTTNHHTLHQAIQAIQYGDRAAGKRLLAQVLHADPRNVQAWLWMSEIADSNEQRRECLDRVIALDPQNQAARSRLAQLDALATTRTAPLRRRTHRQIVLAGGLMLSLVLGLLALLYMLVGVVPRAQARAERLFQDAVETATLWCPSCAQNDAPIPLQASLGAGLYGRPIGELPHGTKVAILDYQWSPLERHYYVEVAAAGQRGWVPESALRR